jgi:hypothetical protein
MELPADQWAIDRYDHEMHERYGELHIELGKV